MSKKSLKTLQLYPREMNIYGDHGNAQVLKKRAELYGFDVEILAHEVGDDARKTLQTADLILGGGGQDSGQSSILADLQKNGKILRQMAADGLPMLVICGLYQLFGRNFRTQNGDEMAGISIFDAETIAGDKRLIGNIILQTDFGEVIGYENHSGLTTLQNGQTAFGEVIKGAGNNGRDQTEGARNFNVLGSYLHGPVLPKNPLFADELIRLAAERKFEQKSLKPRDENAAAELKKLDILATKAREVAMKRPR